MNIDLTRFKPGALTAETIQGFWGPQVCVRLEIKNVQTGELGAIGAACSLPHAEYFTPEEYKTECKRRVRALIIDLLSHEIDECLYIDGARACANPHPEEGTR